LRAFRDFLGRLKDELHPAMDAAAQGAEQMGDGQADGRVPIVAAGVHDPQPGRGVRHLVGLGDG